MTFKKVLLKQFIKLWFSHDEGNIIGDDFDIIPEKKRSVVYKGARVISPGNGNASINWNGAIRLFPTSQWNDMTLACMLKLICHETIHIAIGQLEGGLVSSKYDKLVDGDSVLIIKYCEKTDLFARTNNKAITIITPSARFLEGTYDERLIPTKVNQEEIERMEDALAQGRRATPAEIRLQIARLPRLPHHPRDKATRY